MSRAINFPFEFIHPYGLSQAPQTKADDKDTAPSSSSDPSALRARLKHRAPAPGTSATPSGYSRVLDTAQQLAELERLRAQDAAYIRLLEQGRATLARDAHADARSRAATSASTVSPAAYDEQQRKRADEAERAMKAERERAEKAELRVRALEQALSAAKARVAELEGEAENERRRREEWESGLEQLAMGVTGPSATTARL